MRLRRGIRSAGAPSARPARVSPLSQRTARGGRTEPIRRERRSTCVRTSRSRLGSRFDGPALVLDAHRHHRGRKPGSSASVSRCARLPHPRAHRAPAQQRRATCGHGRRPGTSWRCSITCSCRSPSRWGSCFVQNTASSSTNIRDRMDFSCAVFDAKGGLVANAPHIPVHLGVDGRVRHGRSWLRSRARTMRQRRRVFVHERHPPVAASHLPDITVVTSVCGDARRRAPFRTSPLEDTTQT